MRSNFARRSSAIALAGALAFAGAACADDEPDTEIDVTDPVEDTTIEDETLDTGTETDGATEDPTE